MASGRSSRSRRGFTHAELARLARLMAPLGTSACPFRERPRTNERPHWIRPELVVQVKFSEWTRDGKLRAPAYLGLRDDVRPEHVSREPFTRRDPRIRIVDRAESLDDRPAPHAAGDHPWRASTPAIASASADVQHLVAALGALEARRADALVSLPGGETLAVSNHRMTRITWRSISIRCPA